MLFFLSGSSKVFIGVLAIIGAIYELAMHNYRTGIVLLVVGLWLCVGTYLLNLRKKHKTAPQKHVTDHDE
jgi:hypothetical protein